MDERVVFQMVGSMLNNGAKIIYTKHATERLEERNLTKRDITDILLDPSHIYKEVESSEYRGKYNYRIVGKQDWSAVISIHFPTKLIVVTVID